MPSPGCKLCRRPATERLVFRGRNVLGNAETIAHDVCELHADGYAASVTELGWQVLGFTDPDDGPMGSSLRVPGMAPSTSTDPHRPMSTPNTDRRTTDSRRA